MLKRILSGAKENEFILSLRVGNDGTSGYKDRGFSKNHYGGVSQVAGMKGIVSKITGFFTSRSGMYLKFNFSTPWKRIHLTNFSSGKKFDMTGSGSSFHIGVDNGNYMPGSGATVRYRMVCE